MHVETCVLAASPPKSAKRRREEDEARRAEECGRSDAGAADAAADSEDGAAADGGAAGASGDALALLMRQRKRKPAASSRRADDGALSGHFVVHDFVDTEEEAMILRALDGDARNAWRDTSFNGRSRGKGYGQRLSLATRRTAPPLPGKEMPAWLSGIVDRIERLVRDRVPGAASFRVNECNAIDYRRRLGHELHAHVDDRQLSGPVICNLSLSGDAIMEYRSIKGAAAAAHDVRLPRRCLQVQSGQSRYDYSHGIPNRNLLADRRVSITFRSSVVMRGGV